MTDDNKMVNGWTKYDVEASVVERLQAALEDVIPGGWEQETDPHLSINPGFELPAETADDAFDALAGIGRKHINSHLPVTAVECFHELGSNDPTFVVLIRVQFPTLEAVRDREQQVIDEHGGEILYEPQDAHITIAKGGDGGDDNESLTESERETLKAGISDVSVPETIQVTGCEVAEW